MRTADIEFYLCMKKLAAYPFGAKKKVYDQLQDYYYFRYGRTPSSIKALFHELMFGLPYLSKFNPYHDELGRFTTGPNSGVTPVSDNENTSSLTTPSGIKYGNKIQKDMAKRDWTPEQIDDAVKNGDRIDATNKDTGDAATRYVNPNTGKSVVIDNDTNTVLHIGEPDFRYSPASGDVPGAVMRPAPTAGLPSSTPEGGGGGGGGPIDILHPGKNPWENIEE